jgi:hypothetical protein
MFSRVEADSLYIKSKYLSNISFGAVKSYINQQ